MADPGRVKLAVPASVRRGTVARLRALVLHPQERVERQGGRSSITPIRSGYYMVKVTMAIAMVLLRRPVTLPEVPR